MAKFGGLLVLLALVVVLPAAVFVVMQPSNPRSNAADLNSSQNARANGMVVDGSFVDSDTPNKNFGEAPVLWSDGNSKKIMFFKLDLAKLEPSKVNSANLKLTVVHGSEGEFQVINVPVSTWTGDTITYNVRPLPGETVTKFKGVNGGQELIIDLTDFVKANAGKVASIMIQTGDPNGLSVNSLVSSYAPPELVVK